MAKKARREATWGDAQLLVDGVRAAYLSEVGRLARALRPRFEAGELRATTDEDLERLRSGVASTPFQELERLCTEHFGLTVVAREKPDATLYEGDHVAAHAILAVSPSAEDVDVGDWNHPASWAASAVTWDVLRLARSRGWSRLRRDEERRPGEVP
jgi:hypothetical protein